MSRYIFERGGVVRQEVAEAPIMTMREVFDYDRLRPQQSHRNVQSLVGSAMVRICLFVGAMCRSSIDNTIFAHI